MVNRSTVVVGIDFSEASQLALAVAREVCVRTGSPLELVHVWDTHREQGGEEEIRPNLEYWIRDQKDILVSRLNDVATQAKEWGVPITGTAIEGVASLVLPEVARASGAGLVVLGRSGATNLAHVVLGSVCERVVRTADCPVLVVPERTEVLHSPRRLLVGIDFSESSLCAYESALSFAKAIHVPNGLLLVHTRPGVRELLLQDWSGEAFNGEYPYQYADLVRWAAIPEASGVEVETQILEGRTAPCLLSAAQAQHCDWVVVGVQGRSALDAVIMGGSTDRLLRLADRPVLVVPRPRALPTS